jgi:hypothetical protein
VTKPSQSVCFWWSSARPLKALTLVGLGNLLDEIVVPERGSTAYYAGKNNQ